MDSPAISLTNAIGLVIAAARKQDPWRVDGSCAGRSDINWFPSMAGRPRLDGSDHPSVAAAKAVCRDCSVTDQCLDAALRRGEFGIWGGTTEQERQALQGDEQ